MAEFPAFYCVSLWVTLKQKWMAIVGQLLHPILTGRCLSIDLELLQRKGTPTLTHVKGTQAGAIFSTQAKLKFQPHLAYGAC